MNAAARGRRADALAAADAPASDPQEPPLEIRLPADLAGWRFDRALAQALPQHSRSRLRQWIDEGRVTVDGAAADPTRPIRGGELVIARPRRDPRVAPPTAQPIALRIVHEDATILVIDKPAGLVVHPGAGHGEGTLQNALLHHSSGLAAIPRAGIVHRLDKDTSGLLVVAQTLEAHTALVRALAARSVGREYLAVVGGDLARGGTIDAPIGRHPTQRTKMTVASRGRAARTHYEIVERFGIATLVRCRLETGRTHQIRVHFASLAHPLVGDPVYGRERRSPLRFGRQALHATRLALDHPATGLRCTFDSPAPDDLVALLDELRARAGESAAR